MSRTPRCIILIIQIRPGLTVVLVWITRIPCQNIGRGISKIRDSKIVRAISMPESCLRRKHNTFSTLHPIAKSHTQQPRRSRLSF